MPTIVIADYDARWPQIYEETRPVLERALAQLEPVIEHVGSTSVPGLAAKPIVDIMIGLKSSKDLDRAVPPLQALGYEYVPEFESIMPYRRFFRLEKDGVRVQHLHVVSVGHEFWDKHLVFRDYLRAHPEAAREYARIKREIASRTDDREIYTESKTPFIQSIEEKAFAERRAGIL